MAVGRKRPVKAGRAVRRTSAVRPTSAVRRPSAAPRYAFVNLSSDWYWEQDADLRFTYVQVGDDVPEHERALALNLIGRLRWETGIEVEGGWDAPRALLAARKPFRELIMWRALPDGSRRYVSSSGRPVFAEKGGFGGSHAVGPPTT